MTALKQTPIMICCANGLIATGVIRAVEGICQGPPRLIGIAGWELVVNSSAAVPKAVGREVGELRDETRGCRLQACEWA